MNATGYHDYDEPLSTEERRRRTVDPEKTPGRRINDTLFNRVRWPAGLLLWFVAGAALLGYFLSLWVAA
jgi:hypothetical protein